MNRKTIQEASEISKIINKIIACYYFGYTQKQVAKMLREELKLPVETKIPKPSKRKEKHERH